MFLACHMVTLGAVWCWTLTPWPAGVPRSPLREGASEACLAVSGWRGRRLGHSKHPIRVVYYCHLLSLLNYTCWDHPRLTLKPLSFSYLEHAAKLICLHLLIFHSFPLK